MKKNDPPKKPAVKRPITTSTDGPTHGAHAERVLRAKPQRPYRPTRLG